MQTYTRLALVFGVGTTALAATALGTSLTGCGRDAAAATEVVDPPVLDEQKAAARGLIAAVDAAITTSAPASATTYDPRTSLAPMIEKVGPAVVSIHAEGRLSGGRVRSVFGAPPIVQGTGSGFIISADGLVVTNHHVVDGATALKVRLSDEREFDATILGTDSETDLAVIKLESASGLPTVELGDSSKVRVGDWVVAIGSPLGLEHSASVGIVSAKGRGSLGLYEGDSYLDFLQTDADIAPGSSGGPLFDLDGRVIGINTAVGAGAAGFAIPADQAKAIVPVLRDKGKVVRGWLGAASAPEDKAVLGAKVGKVYERTPAADAGLREGDVIKSVDGTAVKDFEDLRGRIATLTPGHTALLEVERDGKNVEISVVLAERPSSESLVGLRGTAPPSRTPRLRVAPPPSDPGAPEEPRAPAPPAKRLGVQARETDDGLEVAVVEPGSLADAIGVEAGDVLRTVNGRAIKSASDVAGALGEDASTLSVEVVRDGASVTLSMSRR